MGITFRELQNKLHGELDVIPASSLGDRINDALRDIYDEFDWGFLFTDSYIRTPAIIEGQASVTQFENTIVVDSNIKALIDAFTINQVPLGERQVRITNPVQVDKGFSYNILDWDSATSTITIDPFYQDVSNSSAKIQILKLYYTAPLFDIGTPTSPNPVIDFKRFEYIVSTQFNRRIILDASPSQLLRFDPYREYAAEPRYLIPYSANSNGDQLFELYPAPRFERLLRVKYLRSGTKLVNPNDTVSDIFHKDLILSKAKIKVYEYAMANADKLKLKAVGRFANMIVFIKKEYEEHLLRALKKDEEKFPRAYQGNVLDNYYNLPYWDSLNGECLGETLLINF